MTVVVHTAWRSVVGWAVAPALRGRFAPSPDFAGSGSARGAGRPASFAVQGCAAYLLLKRQARRALFVLVGGGHQAMPREGGACRVGGDRGGFSSPTGIGAGLGPIVCLQERTAPPAEHSAKPSRFNIADKDEISLSASAIVRGRQSSRSSSMSLGLAPHCSDAACKHSPALRHICQPQSLQK